MGWFSTGTLYWQEHDDYGEGFFLELEIPWCWVCLFLSTLFKILFSFYWPTTLLYIYSVLLDFYHVWLNHIAESTLNFNKISMLASAMGNRSSQSQLLAIGSCLLDPFITPIKFCSFQLKPNCSHWGQFLMESRSLRKVITKPVAC